MATHLEPGWVRTNLMTARLVDHLGRRERLRAVCEARELASLDAVLGTRPANVTEGRAALSAAITDGQAPPTRPWSPTSSSRPGSRSSSPLP